MPLLLPLCLASCQGLRKKPATFWLRLTDDGVGVHVGGFERGHCTSHGCIRCPEKPQQQCWELCRPGVRVSIHREAHPVPSRLQDPVGAQ
ncbi:MAG: hypothetical protein LW645_13230 [Verrucomicrobiaceae bacterium]|nr:hypothetical protein [Verrucomicrobiaceae bacterium]